MVRAFLLLLRQSRHARVVNVSSEAGSLVGMGAGTPAYTLSKVALNTLTRMLAAELKGEHILVNAVSAGWVATDRGGPGGRPVALQRLAPQEPRECERQRRYDEHHERDPGLEPCGERGRGDGPRNATISPGSIWNVTSRTARTSR
jgi:NAD(P)-dependent dehydrogenase (short-subunit alcohol dehydrogenase family)